MSGGSSGGPWVQNFGVKSSGQSGGLNANANRVVGVTSYGFVSRQPKAQGSSSPSAVFRDLFERACDKRANACK